MLPREADELLRQGAVSLDVREPFEWRQGRLAGSLHIPLAELGDRLAELSAGKPIVAVCRSGNRSGVVTEALRAAGYDAHNLDGGLKAWRRAGLPLEAPGRVV